MAISWIDRLKNISWSRDRGGNNWYVKNASSGYGIGLHSKNLDIAQNHPILTPAILFISKLFSQAEFKVVDRKTGEEVENHWMLDLLLKPNLYQTQSDFLESLQFIEIAQGKCVGYLKRLPGFDKNKDIDSIYLLNSDLIKFPDNYTSKMYSSKQERANDNTMIKYDPMGENLDIKIKDLIFFYDLPNAMSSNFYETKSRLDGLKQTLVNTNDSLIAKNIILKTNGKELISTKGDGFPLDPKEKAAAENMLQNGFGLGFDRKRGIVTKADITYQSLHIALRDLGLDESVKVDGNLIYTALHIPKDILSLEAKKTTYNNFKESMVSYIQNEMVASTNAFCDVLSELMVDEGLKIVGSYDHLPVMQFMLKERYEVVTLQASALASLIAVGVPEETAIEMVGLKKGTVLTPPKPIENGIEESSEEE